jgi:hypothetical protein
MGSEQQLRSTSDQVLATLDRLHELEVEKRSIPLTDPRFEQLAREIEQLAASLANAAEVQAESGKRIAREHNEVGAPAQSIEQTERDVMTILTEWRDAERRASAAVAGSAEETTAHGDVERLRAEYQRAHRAAADSA